MLKLTIKENKILKKALTDPVTYRQPIDGFLRKAGFTVEGRAKKRAPVDTGRYRSSIKTEVQELRSIIGSNLVYAPFIEFGTRPHWPPLSALQPWARRHGFPRGRTGAFLVARAIARRGTKAQKVMTTSLKDSLGDIERLLKDTARDIQRRFKSG